MVLNNPYLDELHDLFGNPSVEIDYDDDDESLVWKGPEVMRSRHNMVKTYSFAIPNTDAVRFVANYSPICEVGAGLGYWAYMLSQAGCEIKAYDTNTEGGDEHYFDTKETKPWFDVEKCDNLFVPPKDTTLFLCWPPYNTSDAHDILSRYEGNTLVYIGEGWEGCTGDDSFFQMLFDEWAKLSTHNNNRFDCMHDSICVYKRKTSQH